MTDAREVTIYDKDGQVAAVVKCDSVAAASAMRDKLALIFESIENTGLMPDGSPPPEDKPHVH
jgi:hypothetical protein